MTSQANETQVIAALAASIFPSRSMPIVKRVREGVSTRVYRLRWPSGGGDSQTLYLRILPEDGASFAPEATAHTLARARSAAIPEVLYVEPHQPEIGRSVMVTSEIVGEPIWRRPFDATSRQVLVEAGRDLARINSVPVEGFGWIRRDAEAGSRLLGEHPTQRACMLEYLEADLATLAPYGLSSEEADAIRALVTRHDDWLASERAWLAHGDFDVTQIFQRDGQYSGIIDFGDIRGADLFYDLGHFRGDDGETLPAEALSSLLAGYAEITPLPADAQERITLASLLITLRNLGHAATKHPERLTDEWDWSVIRRELAALS